MGFANKKEKAADDAKSTQLGRANRDRATEHRPMASGSSLQS